MMSLPLRVFTVMSTVNMQRPCGRKPSAGVQKAVKSLLETLQHLVERDYTGNMSMWTEQ